MVVAVASPSSAAPSADRLHPTYKEMILQALTELRDPSGSSRRAIANYIGDHFTGLHARHDALLSVHLRRLRSHGQLRLVSGNYFVSTATQQQGRGSGSPPKGKAAPGQKRGRGRPRKNADLAHSVFQGTKRGPGRPRKNTLDAVASSSSPLQGASAPPLPSGVKRGRGRPRKNALIPVPSSSSPLLGAIAPLPPSGVKRGRGRPRKNALVPVPSSSSPLLGAIALPPPSGVKRGRGRPRKNALVPVHSSSSLLRGSIAPLPPSGIKRGRGRPRKNAVALWLGVKQGPGGQPRSTTPVSLPPAAMPRSGKSKPGRAPKVAVDISALRGARPPKVVVAGKKKRGRPLKEKMQPESVQSADASLTKRGPGRPRKEKALENGHLKAAQLTEVRHEALSAQAACHAGAMQNEVEDRDLQSIGTSLTEKRGRGRPRKRPLETETAEAGLAAFLEKRGPGRPTKENKLESGHLKAAQMTDGRHEALPAQAADQAGGIQNEVEVRSLQSCGTYLMEKRGRGRPRKRPLDTGIAETSVSALVKKRGRGRPRKARPFETGPVETAIEVSKGLTEERPENEGGLASGKKEKTQGVLVEGIDDGPADAQGVVVSGEEVAIAPMDAGGVPLAGEEAPTAPMDAGGAMPRGDLMDSDVGTKSH